MDCFTRVLKKSDLILTKADAAQAKRALATKGKTCLVVVDEGGVFQCVLTKGDLKRHNVASGSIEQVYNRSPKHIVSASEEEILTQARNIFETYSSINKIPVLDAERRPISFVFTRRNNTMRNNTIDRNYDTWNDTYEWVADGDEWSVAWGSQKAQWYGALYPRIAPWLPAESVLEIAPGHGRWTEFLIPLSSKKYRGVDLLPNCADFCKRRFSEAKHASFFTNNGLTLPMIEDRSCDFVFSFDSLVHVELDVLKSYVHEVLRVLKDDGIAFIHHSNAGEYLDLYDENIPGWRAPTVTASLVKKFIEQEGGYVWLQEKINWIVDECVDCLTLFGREECYEPYFVDNELFMLEAMLTKTRINKYWSAARKF
ncbi:MAG: methyltransferase domain-containing protein [Synergistaceae bacterium]|jgi:SAM-dependent methyltransferase|nr:methyltransferase domain-containing protein [Synergistaceae bacterium]